MSLDWLEGVRPVSKGETGGPAFVGRHRVWGWWKQCPRHTRTRPEQRGGSRMAAGAGHLRTCLEAKQRPLEMGLLWGMPWAQVQAAGTPGSPMSVTQHLPGVGRPGMCTPAPCLTTSGRDRVLWAHKPLRTRLCSAGDRTEMFSILGTGKLLSFPTLEGIQRTKGWMPSEFNKGMLWGCAQGHWKVTCNIRHETHVVQRGWLPTPTSPRPPRLTLQSPSSAQNGL